VFAVTSNWSVRDVPIATGHGRLTETLVSSTHSLASVVVGLVIATSQLLVDVAGAPQLTGDGVGDGVGEGEGDGEGDGEGLGDGDGDGVGVGDGDGVGVGVGVGVGPGVGVGVGEGDGVPCTRTSIEAVAPAEPARAESVYLVVRCGVTDFVPFAGTLPTPLSIVASSAPATSQRSVTGVPASTSVGVAEKRWMERPFSPVPWSKTLQRARARPKTAIRTALPIRERERTMTSSLSQNRQQQ
jgi:hypothetical protein